MGTCGSLHVRVTVIGHRPNTIEGLVELNIVMQAPSGHARRAVRGGTVLFHFAAGRRKRVERAADIVGSDQDVRPVQS